MNISKEIRDKLPPEIQKLFIERCSRGGKNNMSRAKRSLVGKLTAKRNWEKRRRKYGPTGVSHAKRRKGKADIINSIIAKNPDLCGHPVWKES